jgi:hypothetical protein
VYKYKGTKGKKKTINRSLLFYIFTMFKGIQFVITFFIVASLILQIVSILGGFSALRNVYILKVKLEPSSTSSGLLNSILGSSSSSILDSEPSFFTAAPFLVCQGSTDGSKNMCSPASFGYKYGI